DVQGLDKFSGEHLLSLWGETYLPASVGLQSERNVGSDGEIRNDPFHFAVFRAETEFQVHRLPWRSHRNGLTIQKHLPCVGKVDAENEPGRFGPSRPQQTRQPHHL